MTILPGAQAQPVHQDVHDASSNRGANARYLTVFLSLCDVPVEQGPMELFCGTHAYYIPWPDQDVQDSESPPPSSAPGSTNQHDEKCNTGDRSCRETDDSDDSDDDEAAAEAASAHDCYAYVQGSTSGEKQGKLLAEMTYVTISTNAFICTWTKRWMPSRLSLEPSQHTPVVVESICFSRVGSRPRLTSASIHLTVLGSLKHMKMAKGRIQLTVKKGDVYIVDPRVLHRGTANKTLTPKQMLYLSFEEKEGKLQLLGSTNSLLDRFKARFVLQDLYL